MPSLFLLGLFLFPFLTTSAIAQECDISVLRVKDGDSFIIWTNRHLSSSLNLREETHIHLTRVRTPPVTEEAGLRAKETLSELILQQFVGLTIKKPDGYGGYAGEVYLCGAQGQKQNVNDIMIANGWGWKPQE